MLLFNICVKFHAKICTHCYNYHSKYYVRLYNLLYRTPSYITHELKLFKMVHFWRTLYIKNNHFYTLGNYELMGNNVCIRKLSGHINYSNITQIA